MHDELYTCRQRVFLNLRLPANVRDELAELAETAKISLNSAIVGCLIKSLRREKSVRSESALYDAEKKSEATSYADGPEDVAAR